MLKLTTHTVQNKLTPEDIAKYQKEWQKNHAILLPQLIAPELLKQLQKAIGQGEFVQVKHSGVDATEKTLRRDPTINLLEMITADPGFSEVIGTITGKEPMGYFQGRVYHISQSDHDDWHQDTGYNYHMAMSINLSPKPYEGGSLVLRNKKTKKIYADIQNIGFGDALIFDLSEDLEHKITPVSGKHPKLAFAGWYCPEPGYFSYMSKILEKITKKSRLLVKPEAKKNTIDQDVAFEPRMPSIGKNVSSREVGKKMLLVDLAQSSQIVLNDMGAAIWKTLLSATPQEEALGSLQAEFGLSAEETRLEYSELLGDLTYLGYLKV